LGEVDILDQLGPGASEKYELLTNAPNYSLHWYGACVDIADGGETNVDNQCSKGVPVNVPVGKYCGEANLVGTHSSGTVELDRDFMVDIYDNASVAVTGPDSSVPGTLTGTLTGATLIANIPVNNAASGATCNGTLTMDGDTATNQITGEVFGTLPCTGTIDSLAVAGPFTVTKTENSSCPGIP